MMTIDPAAKWITYNALAYGKTMPVFRRLLRLSKSIRRATIAICGLGQYELLINGNRIGQDEMCPGWTNYARTCLYNSYDVTSALIEAADNTIRVDLGNCMYNVTGGRYAKFKGSFGKPCLILQLDIENADASTTRVVTDESWQVAPGPITFSCIYGGEDHDARREDDLRWEPAIVSAAGPGGTLRPQTAPPSRVMQIFKPVKVTELSPDVRVYDLRQNFSGRPHIAVEGKAGAQVKMTTGELLDDTGRVTQKNTGAPVYFLYTLKGTGAVEHWHPRFSYTGFRYVQIEGTQPAELHGQFLHSSSPRAGEFSCSNELFNRIHNLIFFAIASNMQSVLTDCPHREKLGWLEQSHLMGPAILYNFDATALYSKICSDMRDAQHENGCVPTIAPEYVVFKDKWADFSNSPEWGSAACLCPWLIYQRYGDRQILLDNYEMMVRYVEYLHSREEEGIISFGLGDWYDIGPGEPGFSKLTSKALTATAIYYADVMTLRKTAELLGKLDDAARYSSHAQRIRRAFNARFFNASTRNYDTGSQTANAMPLALHLVDPDFRAAVLDSLIADIRKHDDHITAGDIGFHFVLKALAEAGRSDAIFDLLNQTTPPSYGSQLARGATSLTEAWDANPKNSQNHFMLGHAQSWFYEHLAGIQVDLTRPSPDQITIRPSPVGDVTWVKASYQSIFGPVACHWQRQLTTFHLELSLPPNVRATVQMPTAGAQRQTHILSSGSHVLESQLNVKI